MIRLLIRGLAAGFAAGIFSTASATDFGTAITYQGRLSNGAVAANGNFDFQFALFDAEILGGQVGSTQPRENTAVLNGLFSVGLDFGAAAFASPRWLEIWVKPNGSPDPYTVLIPRQRLRSVPHAITTDFATTAATALTAGTATTATVALNAISSLNGIPVGFSVLATTTTAQAGFSYAGKEVNDEGKWSKKADALMSRISTGAAELGGKIYVMGGHDPDNTTGANHCYDPQQDTWTVREPMPFPCSPNNAVAVVNGRIYVINGTLNQSYDPVMNTWESHAPVPIGVSGQAVAAVDGIVYVISGATVQAYDPSQNTWSNKQPLSGFSKSCAGAVVINGRIYVIGGACNPNHASTTCHEYAPATDTWTQKAWIPAVLNAPAVTVVYGRVYAIGGGDPVYNLVYEYDPDADTWLAKAPSPVNKIGVSAVAFNGTVYLFGGQVTRTSAFTPSPTLYVMQKD